MEAKTLEALNASIVAWESRAKGNYLKASADNCPLCGLFNPTKEAPDDEDCRGCPVYEATDREYCESTPCDQYFNNERQVEVAEKEVKFLKSLLPQASERSES